VAAYAYRDLITYTRFPMPFARDGCTNGFDQKILEAKENFQLFVCCRGSVDEAKKKGTAE
jgi:hypothetical protein